MQRCSLMFTEPAVLPEYGFHCVWRTPRVHSCNSRLWYGQLAARAATDTESHMQGVQSCFGMRNATNNTPFIPSLDLCFGAVTPSSVWGMWSNTVLPSMNCGTHCLPRLYHPAVHSPQVSPTYLGAQPHELLRPLLHVSPRTQLCKQAAAPGVASPQAASVRCTQTGRHIVVLLPECIQGGLASHAMPGNSIKAASCMYGLYKDVTCLATHGAPQLGVIVTGCTACKPLMYTHLSACCMSHPACYTAISPP
jgi:hypothetical protein